MLNEAMNTGINDPLHSVADALDAAANAARGGIDDVRAKVSDSLPAVASSLSDITYKTCYAISYGLVFPAAVVVRAIPKENAAVHGLIDGAHAAIDLVNEIRARRSVSG
jgi:hypothetical protein